MNRIENERGQAIVLIALAMVAVLGFAALAVDGGRIYSEKRRAQNAADSAAYAAASAAAGGQNQATAIAAGLNQASFNAYTDANPANNPGQDLDVMIFNPPVDGPYAGNNAYYQAKIRNKVDPVFSQVVYPNGLEIAAEAVAFVQPPGPISPGDAIVALTPHDCQGMKFHGSNNSIIKVKGGNIKSHSDRVSNNPSCNSITQDGTAGTVEIINGNLISAGSQYFPTGTLTISPYVTPQQNVNIPPLPVLPTPDCSNLPEQSYQNGNATLSPGIYRNGLTIKNNTVVTLQPGMYCLDDDLNANGGRLIGQGVMIVMRKGSFVLTAQASIELYRPDDLVDAAGKQWGGMLLFMPLTNTGEVKVTGGSDTVFGGTIYAPGPPKNTAQPKCKIEGNSGAFGVYSSIYCYSVEIGGSSNVTVYYDAGKNYQAAPILELSQ